MYRRKQGNLYKHKLNKYKFCRILKLITATNSHCIANIIQNEIYINYNTILVVKINKEDKTFKNFIMVLRLLTVNEPT